MPNWESIDAITNKIKDLKELVHAYMDVLNSEMKERTHWLGNGHSLPEGSCYFTHQPAEKKDLDSIDDFFDNHSLSLDQVYTQHQQHITMLNQQSEYWN